MTFLYRRHSRRPLTSFARLRGSTIELAETLFNRDALAARFVTWLEGVAAP